MCVGRRGNTTQVGHQPNVGWVAVVGKGPMQQTGEQSRRSQRPRLPTVGKVANGRQVVAVPSR